MVLSRLPVLHYFYSRPPHGGRLRSSCLIEYFWNFYPRPHMEGDTILFCRPETCGISTHALTWRATDADDSWLRGYFISTHALTWRATIIYVTCFTGVDNFYPRPHMEGDIEERFAFPNWGNFYPRPHMEGDCAHQGGPADGATDFYPRPHMEGDEV